MRSTGIDDQAGDGGDLRYGDGDGQGVFPFTSALQASGSFQKPRAESRGRGHGHVHAPRAWSTLRESPGRASQTSE